MNSPRTDYASPAFFFAAFALGHLLRLINQAHVTAGTLSIPMGLSWIALIVGLILCIWFWRLEFKPRIISNPAISLLRVQHG